MRSQAIGVTPPKDMASAWTWQQFGEINDKLVAAKKQQYAFTHNQGGGRWVPSFLYSAGGKVVTDDFKKMAINTPESIEAFTFLKQWTDKKWAPPAIWTTQVPNEDTGQFVRGTASMAILGQWNITYLDENIKDSFKWNVTYLPKDKQLTTSLGGTPIVGWTKTKYPKEVAAFFQYFTSVDKIKQFDEMANYVPGPIRHGQHHAELPGPQRSDADLQAADAHLARAVRCVRGAFVLQRREHDHHRGDVEADALGPITGADGQEHRRSRQPVHLGESRTSRRASEWPLSSVALPR